jgi:hypothetical protein
MSDKPLTSAENKADNIWQKLKERAKLLGYGSVVCEFVFDAGEIKQANVTREIEKIRAAV